MEGRPEDTPKGVLTYGCVPKGIKIAIPSAHVSVPPTMCRVGTGRCCRIKTASALEKFPVGAAQVGGGEV